MPPKRTGSTSHKPAPARRGGRKRRRKGGGTAPAELTSHPTSRNAQVNTRAWLLDEYGPVCAYCGTKHSPRVMTLDHVAPRRGQVAYDRRDNLVLACRACNAAKRDMPPLAFLLSVKSRATYLMKYGKHLSEGLIEMARPLVRSIMHDAEGKRVVYGPPDEDEESPYRD
ncbi:MAG TPA: HNH endonuclease [Gemmatimonadaceae bacterium]|nr:HNH endonuclease [Gemmatimonadaceae bacterium]